MSNLIEEYKKLCELHKLANKLAQEQYKALYAERKLIKLLKETYRPNENYTKWCHKARALARKNWGTKGKRMQIDHITPLLLLFLKNFQIFISFIIYNYNIEFYFIKRVFIGL